MKRVGSALMVAMWIAGAGPAAAKARPSATELAATVRAACEALSTPPSDAARIAARFGVAKGPRRGELMLIRPFKSEFEKALITVDAESRAHKIEFVFAKGADISLDDAEKVLGHAAAEDEHPPLRAPRFLVTPDPAFMIAAGESDERDPSPESNIADNETFKLDLATGYKAETCLVHATVSEKGDPHHNRLISISIIH
jgi:hypothetical protein